MTAPPRLPDEPQVTRLLLIRHGETDWNTESRIQGLTDIPLNARGRWQARRLGAALRDEGLDAVYASDLQRAHDTAQAVAQACGLAVAIEPGLRERAFGAFEGSTFDDIAARNPEAAIRWRRRDPDFGPPGGEVLQAFFERAVRAVQAIAQRHPGQSIALVSHGGVLDCLYRAATGQSLHAPRTWLIANAGINRLLAADSALTLVGWGDVSHLQDEERPDDAQAGPLDERIG